MANIHLKNRQLNRGEFMGENEVLKTIAESLSDLNDEFLKNTLRKAMKEISLKKIIREGLGKGMEIVGIRYERGDYFLSELIMAATLMNESMELLKPLLKHEAADKDAIGKTVIGTVEGDLHDIGKNLIGAMLESVGFEITDLGVDVTPEKFVEAVRQVKPDILCMSTLLSATMDKIEETIKKLEENGLRDTIKVLVGGRCLNDQLARDMGADSYGDDAWDAVRKARMLLS